MSRNNPHEEIPRFIQDKYKDRTFTHLSDWFKCLSQDGQRVRIKIVGNEVAFVDGKVDAAGQDHVALFGDVDDIVIIPYSAVQFVLIRNENLDEAMLVDREKELEAMKAQHNRQREDSITTWEKKQVDGIEEI